MISSIKGGREAELSWGESPENSEDEIDRLRFCFLKVQVFWHSILSQFENQSSR
jgi:hypothetical protein